MKKSRIVALIMVLTLVLGISFTPVDVNAASGTKSMNTYWCLKSGKYVYCAAYAGLYKVNARTGKKTMLVEAENMSFMIHALKKKGGYIYYEVNGPISTDLYRVKINGSNRKKLYNGNDTKALSDYAIDGKKIYVTYGNTKNKVMKLDGSSKKKTNVKAVTKEKNTNNKNYKVIQKTKGDYIYSYLKTPKKKILLEKYYLSY